LFRRLGGALRSWGPAALSAVSSDGNRSRRVQELDHGQRDRAGEEFDFAIDPPANGFNSVKNSIVLGVQKNLKALNINVSIEKVSVDA
jgi:hypothetical protein